MPRPCRQEERRRHPVHWGVFQVELPVLARCHLVMWCLYRQREGGDRIREGGKVVWERRR